MQKPSLLVVDDEAGVVRSLKRLFQNQYLVHTSENPFQALEILKTVDVSVIIADQKMPGMAGTDFLIQSLEFQPLAERILLTAYSDINAIIDAINKARVFYYIAKPWEPEDIRLVVNQAVIKNRLATENQQLLHELKRTNEKLMQENLQLRIAEAKTYDFSSIVTHNSKMLNMFKLVEKVLNADTTVLIEGETGTGKELLARAIHYNSGRSKENFVAQNCAALPETVLESELFGHVKGAFTGAINDKVGLFELAENGTIFLDEIGETGPGFQVKLLRVIQEQEYKPVGAVLSKKCNVRIVSATNRNLSEEVKNGNFREDLFYRLNVFPIKIPALRERKDDILLLAEHFIRKYAKRGGKKIKGLDSDAATHLFALDYPGNVRELENIIERAVLLADPGASIGRNLLNGQVVAEGNSLTGASLKAQVEELEIKIIMEALEHFKNNLSKVARHLGLSRAGLYKKLERYQIALDSE
jgi:two-component system response regulator HupR/HoxA